MFFANCRMELSNCSVETVTVPKFMPGAADMQSERTDAPGDESRAMKLQAASIGPTIRIIRCVDSVKPAMFIG